MTAHGATVLRLETHLDIPHYFSYFDGVESDQKLLLDLFTLDKETGQQANLITIPLQYRKR